MKVAVCKGCGMVFQATDSQGKPVCPICFGIDKNSGIPVEVELPEEFKCAYCKRVRKTTDLLKEWRSIPFAQPDKGLYYCGCRGWD